MQNYHAAIVEKFLGTPCDLEYDAPWPYECNAKDRFGDSHTVTVCKSHHAWWHEERVPLGDWIQTIPKYSLPVSPLGDRGKEYTVGDWKGQE